MVSNNKNAVIFKIHTKYRKKEESLLIVCLLVRPSFLIIHPFLDGFFKCTHYLFFIYNWFGIIYFFVRKWPLRDKKAVFVRLRMMHSLYSFGIRNKEGLLYVL